MVISLSNPFRNHRERKSSLTPCFKPDDTIVSELIQAIADPYMVEPLVIHSRIHMHEVAGTHLKTFQHQLDIADGNHRHKAFENMKWPTCWIFIELGSEHLE